MLVLSRKTGESIVVGENIVVTIVEMGRRRVRLGIEAPTNVRIQREEIAQRSAELLPEEPAAERSLC